MSRRQRSEQRARWCLKTEIGGQPRSFTLAPGENRLGSEASNEIRLNERGISRFHARVSVTDSRITLEDPGSKNGTFLNGEAITECALGLGDRFQIGELELRLESLDPDDATLGLAIDPPTSEDAAQSVGETTLLSQGSDGASSYLRLIDGFLARLTVRPTPDLAGSVAFLMRNLGAESACLVEWQGDAEPIILAAAGSIGELPDWTEVEGAGRRQESDLRFLSSTALGGTVMALRPRAGGRRHGLGLALRGVMDQPGLRELLGSLLHLAHHFKPRPVESLAHSPPRLESELRFPAGIVPGESPAMVSLYQQLRLLIGGQAPLLIVGETGVGKEHLVRLLHDSSGRRSGPFVPINCAAIPEDLLEAEMFGIGKGVATGVQQRQGKFLEADGGTLFLDEIGDMASGLQAKLLRVLQEKEVHPLGGKAQSVNVRVVSATNTDLRQRMAEGAFRQDLYYRLAGYVLEVPALRHRGDDLPRLIGHFIHVFNAEIGRRVRGMTVKALRALCDYPWPGNVRELEHEMRRLVVLCPDHEAIDFDMLPGHIASAPLVDSASEPESWALTEHLEALERRLIHRALEATRGNQTQAAKLLEVSRNGLAKRLKRLGIEVDPASY